MRLPSGFARPLLIALAISLPGCIDVTDFSGSWEGPIAQDDQIRRGFQAETRVSVELRAIDLISLEGTLGTSDGQFRDSALQQIELSSADALSRMTFNGDPIRSYMMFSEPADELSTEAWIVLSLFPEKRIELRIMRRNELFGVFRLSRSPD